jgi:hypothetical protein
MQQRARTPQNKVSWPWLAGTTKRMPTRDRVRVGRGALVLFKREYMYILYVMDVHCTKGVDSELAGETEPLSPTVSY